MRRSARSIPQQDRRPQYVCLLLVLLVKDLSQPVNVCTFSACQQQQQQQQHSHQVQCLNPVLAQQMIAECRPYCWLCFGQALDKFWESCSKNINKVRQDFPINWLFKIQGRPADQDYRVIQRMVTAKKNLAEYSRKNCNIFHSLLRVIQSLSKLHQIRPKPHRNIFKAFQRPIERGFREALVS